LLLRAERWADGVRPHLLTRQVRRILATPGRPHPPRPWVAVLVVGSVVLVLVVAVVSDGFGVHVPALPALLHPQLPRLLHTRRTLGLPRRPARDRHQPGRPLLGVMQPSDDWA